jgi:hypothetical protein
VKTTIDIPEPLYKQAKIRAVETGETLRDLVVRAIGRELEEDAEAADQSFAQRRKLLPEFARFQAAGAFRPAASQRDITDLISQDRDAR